MGLTTKGIFDFWGKAETDGTMYHPAICHMIDVGIAAKALFDVMPPQLRSRLIYLFGAEGTNGLAFLAALHDIGKISPGFQMKREDLCVTLRDRGMKFPKYVETKHGKIASSCLPEILAQELGCPEEPASVFSQILAAHHGVFVAFGEVIAGGPEWDKARKDIVQFLVGAFKIDSLKTVSLPSAADALIFAGLLTLADWLGSSEAHFPFAGSSTINISAYITDRTERARKLIRGLKMDSVLTSEKPFAELFPFPPNPCQDAVLKVVSQLQHPALIIVESPMGTGKTEAAYAAFAHLAFQNGLRGMYYALPTQATGNAMFIRIRDFLEKLDHTGQAELHLLHSNADLNPEYEALKLRSIEEQEGNVVASSWFTARKRGLLASYGTGTIDQSLLAVLKVRHFFLRLFGLSGKLLVLDEVHAYDAYMSEEIFRLIGWLSQCDTSVILLSATLPQTRREKLLDAFLPGVSRDLNISYPCVIGVDAEGKVVWEEIAGLEESQVVFKPLIASPEEKVEIIIQILKEKLRDGGCAACILNTVSEAQAVYDVVQKDMEDVDVILFHSRFTLERRLEIEKQVLSLYGKNGRRRPQKGIVIATQVIEQSLDLDFDFMVSDLAPIDLLMQRAGRLHRHKNLRPSLLDERVLYVIMPDILSGTPNFGGSRYVYFPDILLKTASLFTNQGDYQQQVTINLPYGVSKMIEAVYGCEDISVSECHEKAVNKWIEERVGTEMAKQFAAKEAALADVRSCLDDPSYLELLSNDNDDEKIISSRLARPNVTLIILEQGEELTVRKLEDARRLYGRSLVTDNVYIVRHFREQLPPDDWKEIALIRHCQPLVLRDGKAELENRTVSYDSKFGLQIIKTREVT